MSKSILLKIKDSIAKLPNSQVLVAKYILEQPEAVLTNTVSELAEKIGVSASTIMRFCNSIDLEGYSKLKLLISSDSKSIDTKIYTDIMPGEDVEQITKKLLNNTIHYLSETAEIINKNNAIKKSAALIDQAPTVYVYGIGASHLVAQDIVQKFTRVGKDVITTLDQHEFAALLSIAEKGSIYIGVSNSGEKQSGINVMKLAKKCGLHTISITEDTDNALRSVADVSVCISVTNESPRRTGATISLLNQFFAVDILYYSFFSQDYDVNMNKIMKSRGLVELYENKFES